MNRNRGKLFSIMIAILVLIALVLTGCDGMTTRKATLDTVSDLVSIKVNNYMAQWNNPAFNSTHTGDNGLTVHVPESNSLRITDLIVSPGSTAKIYSDTEYAAVVDDVTNIEIESRRYCILE